MKLVARLCWRIGLPALFAAIGCACTGDLQSLDGSTTALAKLTVRVTGDIKSLQPLGTEAETPSLRAQIVWGQSWTPDPFCTRAQNPLAALKGDDLPLDASQTAVAKAGCRDIFAFAPGTLGPSAPLSADGTATIAFDALPPASVLVGTVDARLVYGAVVIFDDRNRDKTLQLLAAANQGGPNGGGGGGGGGGPPNGGGGQGGQGDARAKEDFAYATSFASMIQPHTRVAYREGTYNAASFYYPTIGCAGPPPGLSLLNVSGSPLQATCKSSHLADAPVELALQPTETVRMAVCRGENARYRNPADSERPVTVDLKKVTWACMGSNELLVAETSVECPRLTHYQLKGCRADKKCENPDWPLPVALPKWWPCGDPQAGK